MPLIGTLTSGVSAMSAFTKDLEVIGNNIANVNTYGFKGASVSFSDSFSNTLRSSSPSSSTTSNTSAVQVGTGVAISNVTTNFAQGTTTSTGSPTDVAISGDGYFVVKNPANDEYFVTRAGNFHWDDKGNLVNDQGYRVQGEMNSSATSTASFSGGLTDIKKQSPNPENTTTNPTLKSVAISKNGEIVGTYSDQSIHTMGSLVLASFKDPSALMKEGGSLYSGFGSAGLSNSGATLIKDLTYANGHPNQGSLGTTNAQQLELANVDLTQQFSDMITVQRSFQASSRLISVSDQILEDIVNLKR